MGTVYHLPKPLYRPELLLDHIESTIDEINQNFVGCNITLAGDFNQLSDREISERTGLTSIVHQPTRAANILDRIYVSHPRYSIVRVVSSVVKSDHQAVVAYSDSKRISIPKVSFQRTYRPVTPDQHPMVLRFISTIDINIPFHSDNTQLEFDNFYTLANGLLDIFYPTKTITVTSRDPTFITARIKGMLRHKNRLMRAGRTEKASAIAKRIGKCITSRNRRRLCSDGRKIEAKDMWAAVRQLTGHRQVPAAIEGVNAQSLNDHYASISNDPDYTPPRHKYSASPSASDYISEWRVFCALDHLRPTATGLDELPAWFLRLGAPLFYKPVAQLFNISLATSTVPLQWKRASITPVAKVKNPKLLTDFRPISVTPVLTRIMERFIVAHFLYPSILTPPPSLCFGDQYAFRPTGSPAAALITLLHSITNLLAVNPYVIVISLDFSKAFDTVRHSTLLHKMAQLNIPDEVYNWLANFFQGHSHCILNTGE